MHEIKYGDFGSRKKTYTQLEIYELPLTEKTSVFDWILLFIVSGWVALISFGATGLITFNWF